MKKIYLFSILFAVSSTLLSQSLGYTDLGVLLSQENYNGTARYNSMSGAFGALGGEVSSIYQNPAGGGVFAKSEISGTYSHTNMNTDATYYGDTSYNTNSSSRFPQFGMVIVFDSPYASSNWTKFTLGFNYSMLMIFVEIIQQAGITANLYATIYIRSMTHLLLTTLLKNNNFRT